MIPCHRNVVFHLLDMYCYFTSDLDFLNQSDVVWGNMNVASGNRLSACA